MKKRFMRIISLIMAFVMTLAMCVSGFAADGSAQYSISIENSIGGVKYNVYKVFDVTYAHDNDGIPTDTAVSYTFAATNTALLNLVNGNDSPFTATLSADGSVYVVTAKTGATDTTVGKWFNDHIDAIVAACGEAAADEQVGTGDTITFNLSDPGYYLIVPESDMYEPVAVSVSTAAPDVTVVDKNQKPGEGGEGKNLSKDANGESFSIGDEISYTISSYVPTYDGADQVTDYIITDKMSAGLTLIAGLSAEPDTDGNYTVLNGVKVEIKGTGLTGYEDITEQCSITVKYDDDETILTITWKIDDIVNAGKVYPADAVVQITYKDLVNEAADDVDMTNSVGMTWDKITPEGPEEGETTDEPEVTLYTYGFDLKKADGKDETSKVLEGAEFTLQKSGGTDLITFIYDAETDTYEEYDGHELVAGETKTTTITAADGEINIWGLGAGTYILTETKAPEGYNLLDSPVTIVITSANNGWTVAVNGETSIGYFTSNTGTTDEHGVAVMPTVTIVNNAGTVLPGTGGIGTTIFYLVGGILILAAAAFAITRWRLGRSE